MEKLVSLVPWLLLLGSICAYMTLSGWRNMRKKWHQPVTFRDYLDFSNAVSRGDRDTIKAIATKYGAIMMVALFALFAPMPTMAAEQPALLDYTAPPFRMVMDCQDPPRFHREWNDLTCELFVDAPAPRPGASGVYLYREKDATLAYAVWDSVDKDGCWVSRGYYYSAGQWVFEKDLRPCDEKKKERGDS